MGTSGRWLRACIGVLVSVLALPATAEEAQTPTAKIIVLARHGHYELDPKADPKLGPGLSTLGIAQAQLLGARLAGEADFDAVRVDPLQRAQDTARVVMQSLDEPPMTTLDDLAECTPPTHRPSDTADSTPESLKACTEQRTRSPVRDTVQAGDRPAAPRAAGLPWQRDPLPHQQGTRP